MTARYHVVLHDVNGNQVALFDSWISLQITHTLNSYDEHVFQIPYTDPRVDLFQLDGILTVYRYDDANHITPYIEYEGFHRTSQRQITDKNMKVFSSNGRGFNDFLRRAVVGYWATMSQADKLDLPAETALKQYVDENLGPSALASNGRVRDHVMPHFTVASDAGGGTHWSGGKSWALLLDVCKEIAESCLIDFNVVRTSYSPPSFEFRTYLPQLGFDRSIGNAGGLVPVVFNPELGNMLNASFTHQRTDENSVVIVIGRGSSTDRTIMPVVDASATDSPWNDIEKQLTSNKDDVSNAALTNAGQAELYRTKHQRLFDFKPIQQAPVLYGRDYFLGDLVTVQFGTEQANKKVVVVKITVAQGKETIDIQFADLAFPTPQ